MASATLASINRSSIHFDSIFSAARERVEAICGARWSDLADHDPGITLLQAIAYCVSDLAYRHTLPLTDLLTPREHSGEGIFSSSFSAQVALTTTPITLSDFRQSLLDLKDLRLQNFVLRDAQVAPLRSDEPSFFYDPQKRTYSHKDPGGDRQRVTLAGGYTLYLARSRQVDDVTAKRAIEPWIKKHRTLCEFVAQTIWLEPYIVDLTIEIELEDDWTDVAAVTRAVARACSIFISGNPERQYLHEVLASGLPVESALNGPQLRYGKLVQQRPRDYSKDLLIEFYGLEIALRAVPGVRRVRSITAPEAVNGLITVPPLKFPDLWGADLGNLNDRIILTKRGQSVPLSSQATSPSEILKQRRRQPEALPTLQYGRYRHLDQHASASSLLPAAYGLHDSPPSGPAVHLHQFLLPFEQLLANGVDQLAKLASLLRFDGIHTLDTPVWGSRWPFDGVADDEVKLDHEEYREGLIALANEQSVDRDKSLELIQYLLSYFGIERADRTLLVDPDDLFATQIALLRQAAELGRQRTTMPANRVSALQQRLAARLGWGGDLFKSDLAISNYPFYIVEHFALLPPARNPAWDDWQAAIKCIVEESDSPPRLVLSVASADGLAAGQIVDLRVGELCWPALAIASVTTTPAALTFDVNSHRHLKNTLSKLIDSAEAVEWRNADAWLRAMDYQPRYATDEPDRLGFRALTLRPFPLDATDGQAFEIESRESELPDSTRLIGEFGAVDHVRGTILAKLNQGDWPGNLEDYTLRPSSSEVVTDQFSSAVTVVFNREDFIDVVDPNALVSWLAEAIDSEFPLNIRTRVLWMTGVEFRSFRTAYEAWTSNGGTTSDQAYALLEMLSLGRTPLDRQTGIGAMRIAAANEPLRHELIDETGVYKRLSAVRDAGLIYVPKRQRSK